MISAMLIPLEVDHDDDATKIPMFCSWLLVFMQSASYFAVQCVGCMLGAINTGL